MEEEAAPPAGEGGAEGAAAAAAAEAAVDAADEARVSELELIQPHMAQKPVLRGEVGCACVGVRVKTAGD